MEVSLVMRRSFINNWHTIQVWPRIQSDYLLLFSDISIFSWALVKLAYVCVCTRAHVCENMRYLQFYGLFGALFVASRIFYEVRVPAPCSTLTLSHPGMCTR